MAAKNKVTQDDIVVKKRVISKNPISKKKIKAHENLRQYLNQTVRIPYYVMIVFTLIMMVSLVGIIVTHLNG